MVLISESCSLNSLSIFLFFLILLYFYLRKVWLLLKKKKKKVQTYVPTNWLILGMIPSLIKNAHRIHDFITDVLKETGGTFEFKGPWFCDMDYIVTSDPSNIHHILSKKFSNYPKGPKIKRIFDILGNGIFNVDFKLWDIQRRMSLSVMKRDSFQKMLEKTTLDKVVNGLIPILDHHYKNENNIDLQDIFQRFTFDTISKLLLDYDPNSLSIDLPYVPCEKAFNDTMEAILYRHVLPESIWKLQNWLGIGKEKKLNKARESFDQFIYSALQLKKKQEKFSTTKSSSQNENVIIDLMKDAYNNNKNYEAIDDDLLVFLRDTVLNLMLAGRDTTSTGLTWLIWLLATNPSTKDKVIEEFEFVLGTKTNMLLTIEESHKLVYLHGAICEALRLYPPVALEHKSPLKPDILPCGMHLQGKKNIILSFYTMGRMESLWGKDCLEFKPDRWISNTGRIKHVPSYKFTAFNAGPRTCLGKEMAFIQMKMVAVAILCRYNIELIKDRVVAPNDSVILQMKQGFPVKLSLRKFSVI